MLVILSRVIGESKEAVGDDGADTDEGKVDLDDCVGDEGDDDGGDDDDEDDEDGEIDSGDVEERSKESPSFLLFKPPLSWSFPSSVLVASLFM